MRRGYLTLFTGVNELSSC